MTALSFTKPGTYHHTYRCPDPTSAPLYNIPLSLRLSSRVSRVSALLSSLPTYVRRLLVWLGPVDLNTCDRTGRFYRLPCWRESLSETDDDERPIHRWARCG